MKTSFFKIAMIAVVGGAAALTSCSKEYTCECEFNLLGTDTVASYTYPEGVEKSEAQDSCDLSDTFVKLVDASGSCDLK